MDHMGCASHGFHWVDWGTFSVLYEQNRLYNSEVYDAQCAEEAWDALMRDKDSQVAKSGRSGLEWQKYI